MLATFIIAGAIRSGKTTAARAIGLHFHSDVVNVGDLLLSRLEDPPADRRRIGPEFLEKFGFGGYRDLVVDAIHPGMVVDGLRSPDVAQELISRLAGPSGGGVFIIHCEASHDTGEDDPYQSWVNVLAKAAESTLPWYKGSEGALLKAAEAIRVASVLSKRSVT